MSGKVLLALAWLPIVMGAVVTAAVPPPLTPSIRTASGDMAPGVHGLLAAVRPQEGCAYSWTITGGTIDSGAGTNQISFGTGNGSSLTLTCTVSNAAGVSATGSIVLPIPTGGLNPLPATTVGGNVQGLTSGSLVLQNNQGNNAVVTTNGPFTFGVPVAAGAPYSVTALSQPSGQTCAVAHANGIVGQAGVGDVAVTCIQRPTYPLLPPGATLGARVTSSGTTPFTIGLSTEGQYEIRNALVTDLDGDGYPEVVLGITTYPGQIAQPIIVVGAKTGIALLSDSMFTGGVPVTQSSNQILAADVNGDGLPDLVIGNAGLDHPPWTGGPIAVALNSGGGKFRNVSALVPASTSTGRSYGIAVGDLHHNGTVDILLPDSGQGLLSETLHWNGSGFDEDPNWISKRIWSHPGDVASHSWLGALDLDGDGFQDVVVGGDPTSPSLRVLYGNATGFNLWDKAELPEGTFGHTPFLLWSTPGNPSSAGGALDRLVIADFDGDGRPDIFAISESSTWYQPGVFTDRNYPGYQDLFQNGGTLYGEVGLQVVLNRGGRVFEDVSAQSSVTQLGRKYYVAAWAADLNNDGAVDVVGTYYTKPYGSDHGFAWGTTFFLNDGTGAFQVVDAAPLLAEILTLGTQGEIELGTLFPTKVSRSGIEAVRVLQRADWWTSSKEFVIQKVVTSQAIGTGPALADGAAPGAPGFNELFYLHAHPDVAAAVRAGQYASGLDHFLRVGRAAGYQAFAQHTVAWGGAAAAAVALYGGNTYHCGGAGDTVHVAGGLNVAYSGPGNDTFSGGAGSDTIVYSGPRTRYQITAKPDGSTTVADSLPGGDGADTITGTFSLRFADATVTVGGPPHHPPVTGGSGGQPVVRKP